MTQEKFKKEWEGILRGISREGFAMAFVRQYEWCERFIRIDGNCV